MTKPDNDSAIKRKRSSLFDTIRTILIAVFIAVFVRTAIFESFNIPSGSMIPTLVVGDYVWVSKFSYGYSHFSLPFSPNLFSGRIWYSAPKRGDVAVFRFTKNTSIDYIKRIIGLPGDHVQVKGGLLYINGKEVPRKLLGNYTFYDEQYQLPITGKLYEEDLPASVKGTPTVNHQILRLSEDPDSHDYNTKNNTEEFVVPEGYFFAMGDNRDNSADSRFMGNDEHDLGFVPIENLIGKAEWIYFSVDGKAPLWAFWKWPSEIRWQRILQGIK